jgi:hypothetical protein
MAKASSVTKKRKTTKTAKRVAKPAKPAAAVELTLRDRLIKKGKIKADDVDKFLNYVNNQKAAEALAKEKDPDAEQQVTSNSDEQLYLTATKWHDQNLMPDGINVVITGPGSSMVTYNGYKNKVRQVHDDATFDVQLVRKGDDFKITKTNGKISYTHELGDPFGDAEISGAYCVVTASGKDYFEALGQKDYEEMRAIGRNPEMWTKWPSEFWLKCVIKRACKRHFSTITAGLDQMDNADFGAVKKSTAPAPDKQAAIIAAAKAQNNA